jgi:hypothetical protein
MDNFREQSQHYLEEIKGTETQIMPSSGMLRRVALVRTDVSEELGRLHHQGDKNQRTGNDVSHN